jgi:16S rRNA processing protein RimM
MSLIQIGRLGRAHGLRGEVVLDRVSLDAAELQSFGSFTWQGANGERRLLELASARPAAGALLVRFKGIYDRDRAGGLTNGQLYAERERVPDAGPGMAYTFQLIGLRVVDANGRELGVVKDVISTGAHPIYVIAGAREILVPAVGPVVRRVDLDAGIITVDLPAGLEDL